MMQENVQDELTKDERQRVQTLWQAPSSGSDPTDSCNLSHVVRAFSAAARLAYSLPQL